MKPKVIFESRIIWSCLTQVSNQRGFFVFKIYLRVEDNRHFRIMIFDSKTMTLQINYFSVNYNSQGARSWEWERQFPMPPIYCSFVKASHNHCSGVQEQNFKFLKRFCFIWVSLSKNILESRIIVVHRARLMFWCEFSLVTC